MCIVVTLLKTYGGGEIKLVVLLISALDGGDTFTRFPLYPRDTALIMEAVIAFETCQFRLDYTAQYCM
jgi:hypothetical protein